VIRSFRSKRLERFWTKGETKQVDSRHVKRLARQLATLDAATSPDGMNIPGWRFHRLAGTDAGRFSVWVDQNWRLTFGWTNDGSDAVDIDYQDYH
jgi:toxin HigB-1